MGGVFFYKSFIRSLKFRTLWPWKFGGMRSDGVFIALENDKIWNTGKFEYNLEGLSLYG